MPVNKAQHVLLADLILCQNVNPSQGAFIPEPGDYRAGSDTVVDFESFYGDAGAVL